MDLLSIMLEYKPPQWADKSYANTRYHKILLDPTSSEFNTIKTEFLQEAYHGCNIIKIERIQHAFAFARFLIRKDHLTKLHGYQPHEGRIFFKIQDDDRIIDQIIEYNCDSRHHFNEYSIFCQYGLGNSSSGYCLVVNNFDSHAFDTRDTHHYPEYLIQYGPESLTASTNNTYSSSNLDDTFQRLRL